MSEQSTSTEFVVHFVNGLAPSRITGYRIDMVDGTLKVYRRRTVGSMTDEYIVAVFAAGTWSHAVQQVGDVVTLRVEQTVKKVYGARTADGFPVYS